MSKAFLDEYGLLPPLLEIMHVNQAVDVLRVGLACIINILNEGYRINKLVEGGLVNVVRPLSSHEDEQIQQYVAAVLLAISSCPGMEEWLVSMGSRSDSCTRGVSCCTLTKVVAVHGRCKMAQSRR